MGKVFNLGVVLVLGLVGVCAYWYINPHRAPNFVRDIVPGLQVPSPQSPMTNFRPPQF